MQTSRGVGPISLKPVRGHRIIITEGQRIRTSIAVPPWLAVTVAVAGVLVTLAYVGATVYLMFRDEIIDAAVSRQARMQYAYEDRLATLRAQIDRINSRQLLDQDAFEAKIDQLMARQKLLDGQAAKVTQVLDRARQTGLKVPSPALPALETVPTPETTGTVMPRPVPFKASALVSPFAPAAPPLASQPPRAAVAERIAKVEAALDRIAKTQVATVDAVMRTAELDANQIERTVARLGVQIGGGALSFMKSEPAIGRPFVKLLDPTSVLGKATAAEDALQRMTRLKASLAALPLGEPLPGDPAITSTFGSRSDPFLGSLAMHTGIDFRAETGDPVYATAPGVVSIASRQGGYGLCVEIDHVQGLATRYGHLSRIAVDVGDKIKPGQIIGYVGSTGRSTGPHLHYETRVNGEPVNPQPWLDAGEALKPFRP